MAEGYSRHRFDFDHLPWLTSPRIQLGLKGVALGLIRIPPDKGYTFTHRHRKQEEVYVIIDGSGTFLVNDDLIEVVRGDIVRVDPDTRRALRAGSGGLFAICAGAIPLGYPRQPGARYLIDDGIPDFDDIPPWYQGHESIKEKNRVLKERMAAARERRREKLSESSAPDPLQQKMPPCRPNGED